MVTTDRGLHIRNYVMGVIASHAGKALTSENIGLLANDITEAVLESDIRWHQERCCDEAKSMASMYAEEDIPQ